MSVAQQVRPNIAGISPYVPGLTDDEIRAKFGLSKVVKLNANENALGPSKLAVEALIREVTEVHHYPDGSSGLLRSALAEFHGVSVESIMAGNGSDDVIKIISETFLNVDDEIVVPKPTFSEYAAFAYLMDAKVVEVPLREDFTYDVQAMLAAVTLRTKLLYVCSPNNPTSTVMTQEQLDWLVAHLPAHVILVIDLAYNDYSVRPDRVQVNPSLYGKQNVITLHTFSKLYGLAGLRVGYGIADPEIWSYVDRIREPFNVNRLAQRAAAAALEDEQHRQASIALAAHGKVTFQAFADARQLLMSNGEGNFTWIRVGDGTGVTQALMKKGVMVRHGFGMPEYIRITYGTAEENKICLQALQEVLTERRESNALKTH